MSTKPGFTFANGVKLDALCREVNAEICDKDPDFIVVIGSKRGLILGPTADEYADAKALLESGSLAEEMDRHEEEIRAAKRTKNEGDTNE